MVISFNLLQPPWDFLGNKHPFTALDFFSGQPTWDTPKALFNAHLLCVGLKTYEAVGRRGSPLPYYLSPLFREVTRNYGVKM